MALATSSLPVPLSPSMRTTVRGVGDLADLVVDGLHRGAAADDVREVVFLAEAVLEEFVLDEEVVRLGWRGRGGRGAGRRSMGFMT